MSVADTIAANIRAGAIPRVHVGTIKDEGPLRICRTRIERWGWSVPLEECSRRAFANPDRVVAVIAALVAIGLVVLGATGNLGAPL